MFVQLHNRTVRTNTEFNKRKVTTDNEIRKRIPGTFLEQ